MQQLCNRFALDFLAGAGFGGLRRGVPAAFRAAIGASFSLPPFLRDFGEDEFVRKDARGGRGGAGGRDREGAGWVAVHEGCIARCARTGEETTTKPGWANATIVQQFRA